MMFYLKRDNINHFICNTKFVSLSYFDPLLYTGMVLKIFLQNEEYLKGITNGYGIRLTIHHPSTFPYPHDEGIFIPAAMETSIGLKLVK